VLFGPVLVCVVWSRLGVEPAGLSQFADNREVFQVFVGLLPPRPSPEKKDVKTNEYFVGM